MRAGRTYCEILVAAARQQHRLVPDMAEEAPVVVQYPELNPLRQIGTGPG
jgi:hypothetical protein